MHLLTTRVLSSFGDPVRLTRLENQLLICSNIRSGKFYNLDHACFM